MAAETVTAGTQIQQSALTEMQSLRDVIRAASERAEDAWEEVRALSKSVRLLANTGDGSPSEVAIQVLLGAIENRVESMMNDTQVDAERAGALS